MRKGFVSLCRSFRKAWLQESFVGKAFLIAAFMLICLSVLLLTAYMGLLVWGLFMLFTKYPVSILIIGGIALIIFSLVALMLHVGKE